MPNSTAIEVENLRKVYRARSASPVVALEGLSLRVERGELFGLLGPNGAGKTTLINILSTLTRPTSGRARVNGFDVSQQPLEVRRSVAVVLQTSSSEMYLSVWHNFVSYGLFQGLTRTAARRKAAEAVDLFGLEEYVHTKCQDLSGGYKRRVQAAKAFLADTPLLFLDEATTGMDAFAKRNVISLIQKQAQTGRTVLLATQILSEAEELCHRVAFIDHGKLKTVSDVHSLKRMAREVYQATVTFEEITPELKAFLERPEFVQVVQRGNTLVLRIQASESRVLELLAEVGRRWPLLHFEVSGASLEDAFVELLKQNE